MVQARRRVSYIIPPPTEPVARLQLPPHGISRLGSVSPLLLPTSSSADYSAKEEEDAQLPKWAKHPRHRLGVASLALDTSTQLVGRGAPEGILYSGGRDGIVLSWDLAIPMRRRKVKEMDRLRRLGGRWETMTGWADDVIDEEAEEADERPTSDGDILGYATASATRRRRPTKSDSLPLEQQWETDLEAVKYGKPSSFRQCAQTHSDWVNDILLCNFNQTGESLSTFYPVQSPDTFVYLSVVSASSDGTIKAWNPHSQTSPEPSQIGSHSDYVRCLALCREQNWMASGSFDRTIKLWDLSRTSSGTADPLITLNPPDATAPKSSVYALAADPFGHAIASGSPERVVRMWDPRSGKRTGKLVGHTDNIRAILISEDSRYLLTGSADASIKLWSLSSQRCLHTFTHHTDSVWSLSSTHPSLEIFYSGDRAGIVCKVDVEDCADVSEGECVVVCHDADQGQGVNSIVTMDDNMLWTATGTSSVKRWKVPGRRVLRAEGDAVMNESPTVLSKWRTDTGDGVGGDSETNSFSLPEPRRSLAPSVQSLSSDSLHHPTQAGESSTLYGIPYESLVKLTSPNDPFTPFTSMRTVRDPEVATLYSAASVMSVPRATNLRSPLRAGFQTSNIPTSSLMQSSRTEDTIHLAAPRAEYELRELAADAVPLSSSPDFVIPGDHGLVRSIILNDRVHALTVDTSGEVAVWDVVRSVCKGRFAREDVAAASQRGSSASGGTVDRGDAEEDRSPRAALEKVRERIEGEAVVAPWATADTKSGVLAIHVNERSFEAEIYADEVGFVNDRHFNDESKLNIGKWVLRNLFLGFIREQQRPKRNRDSNQSQEAILGPSLHRGSLDKSQESSSPNVSPSRIRRESTSEASRRTARLLPTNSTVTFSPKMIPAVSPAVSATTRSSPLLTPMIPLFALNKDNTIPLPMIPQSPALGSNDTTPMPPRRLQTANLDGQRVPPSTTPSAVSKEGDYFSVRTRQPSLQGGVPSTPDDFSGWSGPGKPPDNAPQTPSTPSGLMGMLKNFGKISKKSAGGGVASSPQLGFVAPALDASLVVEDVPTSEPVAKTPLQILLSHPLSPPPSIEAPTLSLPPNMTIVISEESSSGFSTVYRGTVASTVHDVSALEEAMPMWLIEYLLMNKMPSSPPVIKISFVLLPWVSKDPEAEQLPELLNAAQSKLTASRFLRVRKLVVHVQDKLDKVTGSGAGSVNSSFEGQHASASQPLRPRAEDVYEILCNEVVLPLDMTLAAVRQYVWRQSVELSMHYRRKVS